MVSYKDNFCGGAFDDWLEVMLIERCNGSCEWCVEKNGFHPEFHAPVAQMIEVIANDIADNIILLGGEPLLYRDMAELVNGIKEKNIYITTNGYLLTKEYIQKNLVGITGVNISIHDYDLEKSKGITGVRLVEDTLEDAIVECRKNDISVRFNCNIIKGHIDTRSAVLAFIAWARDRGVYRVRFAELKNDKEDFISLGKIMDYEFGLNENPFTMGCNKETVINGTHVNFRQMCGLQTECRVRPTNPKNVNEKAVLYYDGNFYSGWQSQRR